MKRFLLAAVLAVAAVPAFAQVGVSVNVGEPGFYGQIDIGGAPPPALIYSQPVMVQPEVAYGLPPIYLHVPPGYARNWRFHCAAYGACGRPVYFVRNSWYTQQYVPFYHARHYGPGPRNYGHGPAHYDERGHGGNGGHGGRDDRRDDHR